MMAGRGKLIVIEGSDASGKKTQARKLAEELKISGIRCNVLPFPRYHTPTGRVIGQCYLGKKDLAQKLKWDGDLNWFGKAHEVPPKIPSLYYAADRVAAKSKIERILESGVHLVSNRYVESNMGYQGGKIIDTSKRRKFFKFIDALEYGLLELPRPDIVIFLYVPWKVSMQLREKRGGFADGHEASEKHLILAGRAYLQAARMFNWHKINCAPNNRLRDVKDISSEVYNVVANAVLW